jgi:LPS-assembly lipoprotein
MSWSRITLLLCLSVAQLSLLSGCGFTSRARPDIPPGMSLVYIDSRDRYSEFYEALINEMRTIDLAYTDDRSKADSVIRVLRDETGRRTLSVSGRNVPTEFEVFYVIQFAILIDGKEVLEPTRLTRIREYTYDETLVLGKAHEEEFLRRAIATDLVGLVMKQISALN